MIEEEILIQRLSRREVAAPEIFIPNTSGDHIKSVKTNTPSADTDLANKKYVDDSIAAVTLTRIGNANTYVDVTGNVITMVVNGVKVNEWS